MIVNGITLNQIFSMDQQKDDSDRESHVASYIRRQAREQLAKHQMGWHVVLGCDDEVFALSDRLKSLYSEDAEFLLPFSTAWDVLAVCQLPYDSPDRIELARDLHSKCLRALKQCAAGDQPWHAFENINHDFYRLHFDEMPEQIDEWPIEILPSADPCFIIAPDFQSGIISSWQRHARSIRVFGRDLLNSIQSDLPYLFTNDNQI